MKPAVLACLVMVSCCGCTVEQGYEDNRDYYYNPPQYRNYYHAHQYRHNGYYAYRQQPQYVPRVQRYSDNIAPEVYQESRPQAYVHTAPPAVVAPEYHGHTGSDAGYVEEPLQQPAEQSALQYEHNGNVHGHD